LFLRLISEDGAREKLPPSGLDFSISQFSILTSWFCCASEFRINSSPTALSLG
jgi:hypothetical protein